MSLWAVTMVRDELDILPYTLEHLVFEGVDGIIVADNLSNDGTWDWLSDHEASFECEFVLTRDLERGFYQARKMTRLAHQAFDRGADWVIPFDADELWFGRDRLAATFAAAPRFADGLSATLYNHFLSSLDPSAVTQPNPFLRFVHRDPAPASLAKVAVRRRPDVAIEQGNHGAHGEGLFEIVESDLTIAHLPYRSFEQFRRKVVNGAAAYRATTLSETMGRHWRNYGQLLDEGGDEALRDVYETYFSDPPLELEEFVPPWCGALS
jgi:hypothetical protein